MTYTHRTRFVKDRVLHEIRDETGAIVEEYPPDHNGLGGQQLRQFVLERVAELNKPPLKPWTMTPYEQVEKLPRKVYEFNAAERVMVFTTKKCLRCHKIPLLDYSKGKKMYCPQCD